MIFQIVAWTVIAVFAVFFIWGYFSFRQACRRKKAYYADHNELSGLQELPLPVRDRLPKARAWLDDAAKEEATVCAHDGIRLAARVVPAEGEAKGIILLFHGYHSSCRRDLAIQAKALHDAGYHIILTSQRSHGASEGKYICFGAKERRDVGDWCRFAQKRFGDLPIGLVGLSMGSSTVLMATGTDLPPQVRCAVGDCGFTSPWDIILRTVRDKHHMPPYPLIYFMNFWSRLLAGFDFRECSVCDALARTRLPVLLIHGEADTYVPAEMSRRAAQVAPERVTLVLIPQAPHAQAVFYQPEEYLTHMLTFLDAHMK